MTAEFLLACDALVQAHRSMPAEARLAGIEPRIQQWRSILRDRERAQALDPEPVARGLTRITLSEAWPPDLNQMKALEKAFGARRERGRLLGYLDRAESTPVLEDGSWPGWAAWYRPLADSRNGPIAAGSAVDVRPDVAAGLQALGLAS